MAGGLAAPPPADGGEGGSDGGTESLSSDASQGETDSLCSDDAADVVAPDADAEAEPPAAGEEAAEDDSLAVLEVAADAEQPPEVAEEPAEEAADDATEGEEEPAMDLATFASLCEAAEPGEEFAPAEEPGEEEATAADLPPAVDAPAEPAHDEDQGGEPEADDYERLLKKVAEMEGHAALAEADLGLAPSPEAAEDAAFLGGAVDFLAEMAADAAPEGPQDMEVEGEPAQALQEAQAPQQMDLSAAPAEEEAAGQSAAPATGDEEASLAEAAMQAMLAGDMDRYAALNVQLEARQKEKARAAEPPPEVEACADFRMGRCFRGAACRYSHGGAIATESRLPDNVCFDFTRGRCYRERCRFEHVMPPLQSGGSAPSGAGARGAARGGGLAGLLERPPLPPAAEDAQVTVIDPSGVPVPGPGARFAALEEAPFPAGVVADLRAAGCGPPLPELLQLAWPLAASRVDAAVVADPQEGTALAFLPPAFAHIVEHHMTSRCPVLLVAAPTQERSMELDAFARKLGRASGIRTVCCHEGAALQVQARRISMGVHCVIGTPSRLWELLASGELSVAAVSTLVVDGADVALALGLEGHLLQILQSLPEQRHSTVLTGSWSLPVLGLALLAARRPAQVHSGGWAGLSADPDVAHVVRPCPEDGQVAALRDVLREAGVPFGGHHPRTALAFCLSDALGEEAARQATLGGAVCRRLPSGSGEHERAEALQSLRAGASQVLITTDMASLGPGADVSVALVVNVGVPATAQEYIHRACLAGAVDGPLEGGARQRGLIVTLAPEGGDGSLAAVAEVMRRMGQATPWDVESALRRAEAAAAAAAAAAAPGGGRDRSRSRPRRGGAAPAAEPADEEIEALD